MSNTFLNETQSNNRVLKKFILQLQFRFEAQKNFRPKVLNDNDS